MPEFEGFEALVRIDGKRADEFGIEVEKSENEKERIIHCWILSEEGKSVSVEWSYTSSPWSPNSEDDSMLHFACGGVLKIDGIRINSKNGTGKTFQISTIDVGDEVQERQMVLATVKGSDRAVDELDESAWPGSSIGTIQLTVRTGSLCLPPSVPGKTPTSFFLPSFKLYGHTKEELEMLEAFGAQRKQNVQEVRAAQNTATRIHREDGPDFFVPPVARGSAVVDWHRIIPGARVKGFLPLPWNLQNIFLPTGKTIIFCFHYGPLERLKSNPYLSHVSFKDIKMLSAQSRDSGMSQPTTQHDSNIRVPGTRRIPWGTADDDEEGCYVPPYPQTLHISLLSNTVESYRQKESQVQEVSEKTDNIQTQTSASSDHSPAAPNSHGGETTPEVGRSDDGVTVIAECKGLDIPTDQEQPSGIKIEPLEELTLLTIKEEPQEDLVQMENVVQSIDGPDEEREEQFEEIATEETSGKDGDSRRDREVVALKDRVAALEALLREHLNVSIGIDKRTAVDGVSSSSKRLRT
ncbi:hypothetical protein CALCODRAFT_556143 [Calocera cornea HHB12733]|uniref:Uncharacterized protein n=1 Tax=Calocera cornea HHB12733 TaxID=1353952 RepID=A0A165F1G6_9BASI|nr:hypothetical protein CALCODRAFT_556143 [Calocera cornea HHB12733]